MPWSCSRGTRSSMCRCRSHHCCIDTWPCVGRCRRWRSSRSWRGRPRRCWSRSRCSQSRRSSRSPRRTHRWCRFRCCTGWSQCEEARRRFRRIHSPSWSPATRTTHGTSPDPRRTPRPQAARRLAAERRSRQARPPRLRPLERRSRPARPWRQQPGACRRPQAGRYRSAHPRPPERRPTASPSPRSLDPRRQEHLPPPHPPTGRRPSRAPATSRIPLRRSSTRRRPRYASPSRYISTVGGSTARHRRRRCRRRERRRAGRDRRSALHFKGTVSTSCHSGATRIAATRKAGCRARAADEIPASPDS